MKLKLLIGCSSEAGMPLLPTSVTLSSCGLGRVTRQVAEPEATTRSRLALIWSGPHQRGLREDGVTAPVTAGRGRGTR